MKDTTLDHPLVFWAACFVFFIIVLILMAFIIKGCDKIFCGILGNVRKNEITVIKTGDMGSTTDGLRFGYGGISNGNTFSLFRPISYDSIYVNFPSNIEEIEFNDRVFKVIEVKPTYIKLKYIGYRSKIVNKGTQNP